MSKDRLVDLLWGEEAPASAVATLESYVCVRASGHRPRGGRRASVVLTTSAGYRLDTTRVAVDLTQCQALLSLAAAVSPAECVRLVRQALALCGQPLLATETRAAWADRERDAFGHRLGAACATAARAALGLGDLDGALELSARAADLDPLDEGAVRTRMAALAAAGRRAEGLQCFLDLRRRLVTELGVEPGHETRCHYVELLTDAPTGASAQRPTRSEVAGLLDLLRDTLTRVPGLDPAPVDRALARVASVALQLL